MPSCTTIDTNLLIDLHAGLMEASDELARYEEVLISRLVWIEFLTGARTDKMWNERQLLVREFTILELDREVSAETIRLRQRTRLKLPDAIIWATARVHDLQLVTCNSRDFSANDPGIRIPYKRRPA